MARTHPPIDRFVGDYSWLSNFERCHHGGGIHVGFAHGGPRDIVIVDTVEHAYQASKATTKREFLRIAFADSPGEARRLGRLVRLPWWWGQHKVQIMGSHLRQKFLSPVLARMLVDTWPRELIEGNTWGDRYWGVDAATGVGENKLGRLLMEIREEKRGGAGAVKGGKP